LRLGGLGVRLAGSSAGRRRLDSSTRAVTSSGEHVKRCSGRMPLSGGGRAIAAIACSCLQTSDVGGSRSPHGDKGEVPLPAWRLEAAAMAGRRRLVCRCWSSWAVVRLESAWAWGAPSLRGRRTPCIGPCDGHADTLGFHRNPCTVPFPCRAGRRDSHRILCTCSAAFRARRWRYRHTLCIASCCVCARKWTFRHKPCTGPCACRAHISTSRRILCILACVVRASRSIHRRTPCSASCAVRADRWIRHRIPYIGS